MLKPHNPHNSKSLLTMNRTPKLFLLLAILCLTFTANPVAKAQNLTADSVQPVKNVILMITDGTSLPSISLARWYQRYQNPNKKHLRIDPYLCGTILTYCSNSPIGDSAPTTSCYMTGMPSIAGFVSTYPYSSPQDDIVPVDTTWSYRPLMTLMEATRIYQGKKTGIVVTSHLTDATPSDCLAHSYDRRKSDWIMPQIVHSGASVIMGGRTTLLKPEFVEYLKNNGYGVYSDDLNGMRADKNEKIVALFGEGSVPFDLDRDTTAVPSLAEMTATAIRKLDNEKGFMLMVEGSKVDWAAHANDPVGVATDLLAFDKAVGVALDFAQQDGNTVVIVTSDHGNSGLSIGRYDLKKYAQASAQKLFGPLTQIQKTAVGMAEILRQTPYEKVPEVFQQYTGITLNKEELEALQQVKDYDLSPLPANQRPGQERWGSIYTKSLDAFVGSIYRKHSYIGFTTHGHTGEEVFLAISAPKHTPRMVGFNTNIELHNYMRRLLGLPTTMQHLSQTHFAPHDEVFQGYKIKLSGNSPEEKVLTVTHKKKTLVIPAFSNQATLNGKTVTTPCASVFVDKTGKMYVEASLAEQLQ